MSPSWRLTHWNKLNYCIFKQKRNRKFDFFSERSIFISLMNIKSGIFTRGFATRENTAFLFIRWNENRSYTEKVKYPLFLIRRTWSVPMFSAFQIHLSIWCKMTSYQRLCDVITSHRRWYDVIFCHMPAGMLLSMYPWSASGLDLVLLLMKVVCVKWQLWVLSAVVFVDDF